MSDMYTLFSVIIPIYKVEKYLSQCIDSVLNQSFNQPFEIILVDDGSPDRCPVMCDEYAEKDKRVKVIHKTNGGLSDARNIGMGAAIGEYIVFLDSDDFFSDIALQNIASVITESNKPDVVMFRFQNCSENGTLLDECLYKFDMQKLNKLNKIDASDMHMYLLCKLGFFANAWNVAYRRNFLIKKNINFVKGILCEDTHWSSVVLLNAKTFGFSNEILYFYRLNRPNSIMNTLNIKRSFDIIWIFDDLMSRALKPDVTYKQAEALRYKCFILICNAIGDCRLYLKDPRIKELKQVIKARSYILAYNFSQNKIRTKLRYIKFKIFGFSFFGCLVSIFMSKIRLFFKK